MITALARAPRRFSRLLTRVAAAGMVWASLTAGAAHADIEQFSSCQAQAATVVDHAEWGRFLDLYLKDTADGRTAVAYGAVSDADSERLKAYLADLQAVDPTALSCDEAFAYWINLYNALTVDLIVDNYPLSSIRTLWSGFRPGPWARRLAEVNGDRLTLDQIEHGILRPYFNDNRVHYAVNCASVGCPNLAHEPYTGDTLEDMLQAGAEAYANHPRGFRIEADGTVVASSIYSWFQEDFGGDEAGVIDHLKEYGNSDVQASLSGVSDIDTFEYDWSLNDAPAEVG